MNTKELSNRLTQIVQGITNTHPIRIKATIEVFLEEFDPSQNYLLSISDIEGYETQFIEFELEQPDPEDLEPDITFNADDITFKAYFD